MCIRDSTDDVNVVLNPGDKVSFTAVGVENYFGLQVNDLEGFTVDSTGNPIYVQDVSGTAIDAETNVDKFIHVYGEIIAETGSCGGSSLCYTLDHGNSQTGILRASDQVTFFVGDCVDLYLPLGNFQGNAQFDLGNFDWYTFF